MNPSVVWSRSRAARGRVPSVSPAPAGGARQQEARDA